MRFGGIVMLALFLMGGTLRDVAGDVVEGSAGASEGVPATPHFQEVLRLLRGNLVGVTEEELNAAMVRGLLDSFHPRARLVDPAGNGAVDEAPLRRVSLYRDSVGYLGVRRVGEGLVEALTSAQAELGASNTLSGWVLDLRVAGGQDYRAAAKVADQFVAGDKTLIRFDQEELASTGAGQSELAVVVLVNGETSGAAEALAGALRAAGPVVVLGSRTAGQAYAMRAFELEDGRQLQIASAPVRVGEDQSLEEGLEPDLEVKVPAALERIWVDDPFYVPAEGEGNGTVVRSRPRFDEAALVREHEGLTNRLVDATESSVEAEQEPRLQDEALVRALDMLKGLARVRMGIRR